MLSPRIRAIIEELSAGLTKIYGDRLREVYVYGSHARGRNVEGSDLDTAIILDDFRDHWEEIQRSGPFVAALSLKHGITISIYRIREHDWLTRQTPLLDSIRQEGTRI